MTKPEFHCGIRYGTRNFTGLIVSYREYHYCVIDVREASIRLRTLSEWFKFDEHTCNLRECHIRIGPRGGLNRTMGYKLKRVMQDIERQAWRLVDPFTMKKFEWNKKRGKDKGPQYHYMVSLGRYADNGELIAQQA